MSREIPSIPVSSGESFIHSYGSHKVHSDSINLLLAIVIFFLILYVITIIGYFFQIIFRFCLPRKVHPTLQDVLPSSPDTLDYPFVVVQLPMRNEIECCASIIECVCNLNWPKTRFLVQVLDDSSEEEAIVLVDRCVNKWRRHGMQIVVIRRSTRDGFKAGSMKNGMALMPDADYIAIFDADFLPKADFLLRTVPALIKDPLVAFVQARWTFTNAKESLFTRLQEIWFNFHHKCEQEGSYRASVFFGFNGTAGVWRISTIEQCGGWHADTLVEDMDLSLRAHLNGWRSVYMKDVECLNEIPPTFSAYLSQQHRWTCGPMQIIRKLAPRIIASKHIVWKKKLWCFWFLFRPLYNLFHFVSLLLLLPISISLEVTNTVYLGFLLLTVLPTLHALVFTPAEIHLGMLYVLFYNAVSLHRAGAIIAGLFNFESARQWIVTPKYNLANNTRIQQLIKVRMSNLMKSVATPSIINKKPAVPVGFLSCFRTTFISFLLIVNRRCKFFMSFRFYKWYFVTSLYLFSIGCYGFVVEQYILSAYSLLNAIMFAVFSFGAMGRSE